MICYCQEGYSGARCDLCADNYYGNPEKPGGVCQKCECSDNIDPSRRGNCDLKTGKCLQCLYETTGDHCEFCKDGFFGDALQQNCRRKRIASVAISFGKQIFNFSFLQIAIVMFLVLIQQIHSVIDTPDNVHAWKMFRAFDVTSALQIIGKLQVAKDASHAIVIQLAPKMNNAIR